MILGTCSDLKFIAVFKTLSELIFGFASCIYSLETTEVSYGVIKEQIKF